MAADDPSLTGGLDSAQLTGPWFGHPPYQIKPRDRKPKSRERLLKRSARFPSGFPRPSLILQRHIDRRRECKRCRGSRLQQA